MTSDEIQRLRELANHMHLTSLPWEVAEIVYEEDKPYLASRFIRTICIHPQLKAPEEIVTMMHCHPKFKPEHRVYIRPEHADYIVAACNALPGLLDELDERDKTIAEFVAKGSEALKEQNKILREGLRQQYKQNAILREAFASIQSIETYKPEKNEFQIGWNGGVTAAIKRVNDALSKISE